MVLTALADLMLWNLLDTVCRSQWCTAGSSHRNVSDEGSITVAIIRPSVLLAFCNISSKVQPHSTPTGLLDTPKN